MPDKREIYALKRIISLLSGMTGWDLVSLLSGMAWWVFGGHFSLDLRLTFGAARLYSGEM